MYIASLLCRGASNHKGITKYTFTPGPILHENDILQNTIAEKNGHMVI